MGTPMDEFHKRTSEFLKLIRRWDTEFLCMGTKKDSFSAPRPEELQQRINANLEYFLMNYLVIIAALAILAVVFHPLLLVMVVTFCALWTWLLSKPPNFKIQVQNYLVTRKHMTAGLTLVTGLVMFIFARHTVFMLFGASALLVGIHASLHSVPSAYTRNKQEMQQADDATP